MSIKQLAKDFFLLFVLVFWLFFLVSNIKKSNSKQHNRNSDAPQGDLTEKTRKNFFWLSFKKDIAKYKACCKMISVEANVASKK